MSYSGFSFILNCSVWVILGIVMGFLIWVLIRLSVLGLTGTPWTVTDQVFCPWASPRIIEWVARPSSQGIFLTTEMGKLTTYVCLLSLVGVFKSILAPSKSFPFSLAKVET